MLCLRPLCLLTLCLTVLGFVSFKGDNSIEFDHILRAPAICTDFPLASEVQCGDPIVNSCGEAKEPAAQGSGLNVMQCMAGLAGTTCGQSITDSCGNDCQVNGTRCEPPQMCYSGTCKSSLGNSCADRRDNGETTKGEMVIASVEHSVFCDNTDEVLGGGWMLVRRRAAKAASFHPLTDQLSGSEVYGTYVSDDLSEAADGFSMKFDHLDFTEYLFKFGDGSKWAVLAKADLNFISTMSCNQAPPIVTKESQPGTVTPTQCIRVTRMEDPWISCDNHGSTNSDNAILYGANSYTGVFVVGFQSFQGINVYIR